MLRHVEQVFGGGFDGALDGLVELAWTDPATGALRHGQLFGTDQLEELASRAEALNRVEGCNVYLGAALRKPGTAPDRRASDAAFHSAPFAWADIDDDCVGAAIQATKSAGAPPTMTVVTGRHPHLRAQLWWRLAEAERDAAAIKALCSGIGLALGGDSTVSNPSRVLRLGGSIAWPVKPGRVQEAHRGSYSRRWPTTGLLGGRTCEHHSPHRLRSSAWPHSRRSNLLRRARLRQLRRSRSTCPSAACRSRRRWPRSSAMSSGTRTPCALSAAGCREGFPTPRSMPLRRP